MCEARFSQPQLQQRQELDDAETLLQGSVKALILALSTGQVTTHILNNAPLQRVSPYISAIQAKPAKAKST
jgi:poly(A) polymerase Pap1